MSGKKPGLTSDELLAQLDDLSKPGTGSTKSTNTATTTTSNTTTTTSSKRPAVKKESSQSQSQSEQDLLAELGNLAQKPASRAGTPSLKADLSAGNTRSPKRTSTATPPPGRSSEDKSNTRKSGESTRSYHQAFTPATTTTEEESPEPETEADAAVPAATTAAAAGGGWWGGLISSATAAVSQAQAVVKEMQKNEEAQKWTDQLRGNIGVLKGYGGDLRSMALPTFQNIMETLAPPISAHERLAIHITHDLQNYPALDPTIYQVFNRVMSQVEGGDLMVIQRGAESGPKRNSKDGNRPVGAWQDGPWWRSEEKRDLNAVKGLVAGTKLARTSAETYATDFFANKGGVEAAAKEATETLSESNPTRDSVIFLAIQAISQEASGELFQSSADPDTEGQVKETKDEQEEVIFAVYLHDPVHGIAFHALSQGIPSQWIEWLDAPAGAEGTLPDSIQEIIESGGVDPREWVSEWIEEALSLTVGIVAQRYVARRMGIGEGGVGRGKGRLRADLDTKAMVEGGGGEAARAV